MKNYYKNLHTRSKHKSFMFPVLVQPNIHTVLYTDKVHFPLVQTKGKAPVKKEPPICKT